MPNRLAQESSPYLFQHANNPVEWYPWGPEALEKARAEDRPILLSIGYAACHWCHVMEHESFEDPETAAFMNENFVNIKVDREERPDLDNIYMNAVVAMTGQGGWPMTVFLTPEGQPFFGGTYFPRESRYGMPGFKQVMVSVLQAWEGQRQQIEESAEEIAGHLNRQLSLSGQADALTPALFEQAVQAAHRTFEPQKGGFGRAPKFPQPMTIEFLLRMFHQQGDQQALHMAVHTLEQMAKGGMYDQLGGGFARYSTDNEWLVPHFEKMLYDNALLSRVYLHAWQVTGQPLFRQITEETLDWVAREMRHPQGGFYSSLDADSEGEEGRFYVWTPAQVRETLADEQTSELFARYYDVTESGNWEGNSILHVSRPLEEVAEELGMDLEEAESRLARAREHLYKARAERVWPGLDDKVLTAWNGLMLASFAEAGRLLERPDYLEIAVENARFLHDTMRTKTGRLLRTWKEGSLARYNAYLEDYAYLAEGLLTLYQSVFDEEWYQWAKELADMMLAYFVDEHHGGFYDTSEDHEQLIQRPKDVQDNAIPSGNAMAANALLQLGLLSGEELYWDVAQQMVAAMVGAMAQYPTGFAQWLIDATLILGEAVEIAIVGEVSDEETEALLDVVFGEYRPFKVVAVGEQDSAVRLLHNRPQRSNRPTAYVCRQFACKQPVVEPEALAEQLA